MDNVIGKEDANVLKSLVTLLLKEKPSDPVAFIYSYISQYKAGKDKPIPITNMEVAQIKNLRKKVEHLQNMLGESTHDHTESSQSEDSEEEEKAPVRVVTKQRAGVSAEVFGAFNKKQDFVPKIIQKSEETKEKLRKRLLQAFMFNALDETEFKIVIDAIEEVKVMQGENVITQGDQGDCMYVVEQGSLSCYKTFPGQQEPTFLKKYSPGEGFGELALLYNAPRAATITADEDSSVLKLDRDTFNNIVKQAARKKHEKYDQFLKDVQVLQNMEEYERGKLCDAVREENFNANDYIIRQGEAGNKFFLIVDGQAKATMGQDATEQTVKDYVPGQYFGERALITNEVRAANVIAVTNCKCLTLERDTFQRLLGPLKEILERNMQEYKKINN